MVHQPVTEKNEQRRQVQRALPVLALQPLEPMHKPGVLALVPVVVRGLRQVLADPVFLVVEVVTGVGPQLLQQGRQVHRAPPVAGLPGAQQQVEQHLVLQVDGGDAGFQARIPCQG